MNDVQELIEAVSASGATIRVEGPNLKIKPAGVLPPELKARLKENKTEVLQRLEPQESLRGLDGASTAWEWIEERAAIMESDGGLNRDEAHHRAFMLWYGQFVERKVTE
jgi:hypothetical protein